MQTLISVVATTIAVATMATWPLLGYLAWRFRRDLPRLFVNEAKALGRTLTPNGTGRWSMAFCYALGEVTRLTRREHGSTQVMVPVLIVGTVIGGGAMVTLGGVWLGLGLLTGVAALVWCWDYLS